MNFKHELSPSKPLLRSTQSLILGPIIIPTSFCHLWLYQEFFTKFLFHIAPLTYSLCHKSRIYITYDFGSQAGHVFV